MESRGSVAVLSAVILLAASITQVSTQLIEVQCFTASSTTTATGCESSDPSFIAASIEECCVQSPEGLFYRQTSGDQSCQACIVFGWLNGTELAIEEQSTAIAVAAGFIKGAEFQQFTQQDRRGQLRFITTVVPGTARMGANFDFTVSSTRFTIGPDATVLGSVMAFIRIDSIALETREDFTLSLVGGNDAARAALRAEDPNTFAFPSIQVIIEDMDDARLQFTESDYSSNERQRVISPSVQLLTEIATSLTVVAVPVNYTFLNDSQSPLLGVIPDVADYNPRRPINATSFPIEDRDFDISEVVVSFPAGNMQVQGINITIVDDGINEVEQIFVIFLRVVDAVNPDRVNLQFEGGRNATLGIILDDDTLTIGFEQSSYTIFEAFNGTGELIRIPVVKGNNRRTELTFSLTFSIVRGAGPNSANIDQMDRASRDIVADLAQEDDFPAERQNLDFLFELVNDDETEMDEVFQVEMSLSQEESGLNVNLGGGSSLFATTEVFIVDDDEIQVLANDTVIGDPLFTVPVYVPDIEDSGIGLDSVSLCYELHGQSDEWFNLVTDECTSVNAHYIGAPSGLNVIDQIAIRAVDGVRICREILVQRDGCTVELDGTPLNGSRFDMDGIMIRRYSQRVRVAVPNCQEQNLVMWITCETRTIQISVFDDPIIFDSIRFDVLRGLNFGHRDSHGIIGQFWNVPIQLTRFNGVMRAGEEEIPDSYIVNVTRDSSPTRVFTGWFRPFAWGRLSGPCLYAGNRQAGVIYEVVEPNDPVIEGSYESYRVPSAFEETGYQFRRFEENMCL